MEGSEQRAQVETEVAMLQLVLAARGLRVDADAINRVRRMLQGKLTLDQARAEIAAKYGRPA